MKESEKIIKARQMRYKKPIVKDMNFEFISNDLWDITEACEEIRWYTDSEDGQDSLINALNGDEDEAYEFKMAFADLCAECEQMRMDIEDEWVPDCFDILFVAAKAGDFYGDILGYDAFEQDYYGLYSHYESEESEREAKKKLMQMTKEQLIDAMRQCFRIYASYIGLRNRYDNLKAAIDILRDQNTGYLQAVKEIEKLYADATQDDYIRETSNEFTAKWEAYTEKLPPEAWIA